MTLGYAKHMTLYLGDKSMPVSEYVAYTEILSTGKQFFDAVGWAAGRASGL